MNLEQLQLSLIGMGYETGAPGWGPMCRAALLAAMTDGPDYELTPNDNVVAATLLDVEPYKVRAVCALESTGEPFINGRPTILFEPHRFSKATGHRFDASHPKISSRSWNKKLYPGSQAGRYEQLLDAVELDVDAGFASASYGAFQILGENYASCGAATPWAFAWRQCQTEGDQLDAFVRFIQNNRLTKALRDCQPGKPETCVAFVSRYNGTAYRENKYDSRFAKQLTIERAKDD